MHAANATRDLHSKAEGALTKARQTFLESQAQPIRVEFPPGSPVTREQWNSMCELPDWQQMDYANRQLAALEQAQARQIVHGLGYTLVEEFSPRTIGRFRDGTVVTADGDEFTQQQQIDAIAAAADGDYYAFVSVVPQSDVIRQTLAEFDRELARARRQKDTFFVPPKGTAELLYRGTQPHAPAQSAWQAALTPQTDTDRFFDAMLPEDQRNPNWAALPPDDPRARAYMDGLTSRSRAGLLAVTQVGAQRSLSEFSDNVQRRVEAAVARGDVRTEEQARAVFMEAVEAAIKDNGQWARPGLGPDGQLVFADQASWMRYVADLSSSILAPVLAQIHSQPKPTRPPRVTKHSGFRTPSNAKAWGNTTLDKFFKRQ